MYKQSILKEIGELQKLLKDGTGQNTFNLSDDEICEMIQYLYCLVESVEE